VPEVVHYVAASLDGYIGAGIPLFASGGIREALKLVETNAYPSGIVQLRYSRGVDA